MGFYRIVTRDRQYHLVIQNTVKDLVQTVEHDLQMFCKVPNWVPTPIKVRQETAVQQVRKKHGNTAALRLHRILEIRTAKLERYWDRVHQERFQNLQTPYVLDPEVEEMLT